MSSSTILMVDDEPEIIKLMEVYMKNENYTFLTAADGFEALSMIEKHHIDLVVLDIMLPNMNGIETCIKIRETHFMPIIMLSAKGNDMDIISGLSIGADDYVTKPFSPLELLARIKSHLRRVNQFQSISKQSKDVITIDQLSINVSSHIVIMNGTEVKLTPREFAILKLLAEHKNKVLTMDQIYEQVWGEAFMESKNSVMVHIRKLREKLEENPQKPNLLKTVWGVGYKLEDINSRSE